MERRAPEDVEAAVVPLQLVSPLEVGVGSNPDPLKRGVEVQRLLCGDDHVDVHAFAERLDQTPAVPGRRRALGRPGRDHGEPLALPGARADAAAGAPMGHLDLGGALVALDRPTRHPLPGVERDLAP